MARVAVEGSAVAFALPFAFHLKSEILKFKIAFPQNADPPTPPQLPAPAPWA
jgi:hypothetical protein